MLNLFLATPLLLAPAAPAAPTLPSLDLRADDADQHLARGRELLEAGEKDQALAAFEAAVAARDDTSTRVWLWRAWISLGRVNDATNALEKAGVEGPAADYLFGMASYARAMEDMRGNGGGNTRLSLMDSVEFLGRCLKAEPDTYGDGWLALAHAAYLAQEPSYLERATEAAERAVARRPKSDQTHYVQGLVAFWQFQEARAAERQEAADKALQAAIAAHTQALAQVREDKANAARLAELQLQVATCQLWAGDRQAAAAAYSGAMGWDPRAVDFGQLWNSLATPEDASPFVACLLAGDQQYAAHYGADDRGDATLLWWLGYGQYAAGQFAESDATFGQVLVKYSQYLNSHWYQGLCRYQQADYAGAAEAWVLYARKNQQDMVNMVKSQGQLAVDQLAFTQGKRVESGPRGFGDAADLAEVLVAVEPQAWRRWNDLGLFARDAGEVLQRTSEDPKDVRRAQQYFERSWEAYGKAMELAPDKPHLKNDAAVILHYYLDRDAEQAKRLYEQALEQANQLLEKGELEGDDLVEAQTAQRDARNNLEKLAKGIKRPG